MYSCQNSNEYAHVPVMLEEVLEYLGPKPHMIYLDCTLGMGGHTHAILRTTDCKVIAIDRDPKIEGVQQELKEQFGDRFEFIKDNFCNIRELLKGRKVDGVLLDLGTSNMQLRDQSRGFSFSLDSSEYQNFGRRSSFR